MQYRKIGTPPCTRALTRVEQKAAGDFAVVVIGASYGGVEAIEKLFADLPGQIRAATAV